MQSTNESQSQHQPTASRSSILGFVVQSFGYTVGFITLACIAVGGLIFFALLMPETKPEEGIALRPHKVPFHFRSARRAFLKAYRPPVRVHRLTAPTSSNQTVPLRIGSTKSANRAQGRLNSGGAPSLGRISATTRKRRFTE